MVEKPLAANLKEAEDLIKTAEKNGKLLMVDHTFLYTGSVRKMKELISNNELGELYYFDSVRINLGLFQSDVNVIWDLAPHDFSIACHLLGEEPVSVSALGRGIGETEIECLAYVTLKFRTGIIAHIHVSWLSPVKVRQIILGGSKKMIIYDDVEPSEKIKVYDRRVQFDYDHETSLQPTYRLGDIYLPKLEQHEPLNLESRHFVDCILSGKKPLTDGASGLTVVRILEACDASLSQGGREIELNRIF
jgi:predicted dehydrogenase